MNNVISSIVIPMTRRDVPELYDLFSIMPDPGLVDGKVDMVVTLDLDFDEDLRAEIKANFLKCRLDRWFELSFIDCGLTAKESIYIRKYFDEFDRSAYPYGMKSGPNIQFFQSLRLAMSKQRKKNAMLLLETDITPLYPGWLSKIADELPKLSSFLVAGPKYTGATPLPAGIKDHVNGASVYNWAHPDFPRYLELWDTITRLGCRHAPWHAYDTIAEWLMHNLKRFESDDEASKVSEFASFYRSYVVRISSIVNLSGTIERDDPKKVPDSLFWKQASIHLRAPLSVRKHWQNLVQGKWKNMRVEGVAVDREWQYPAITEKNAFERLRGVPLFEDTIYFAFPWATLFDQCLHKPTAAKALLADLKNRSPILKRYSKVATVCQHVHLREFLDIMSGAGVTDVFWSHTTNKDMAGRSEQQIKLHPFPLYPVQFPELSDQKESSERPFLFSFIGSYSPRYYLSESRNHIINMLRDHPKGHVIERRKWHYNTVVYDHQILGNSAEASSLVDDEKSTEFRASLVQSTFSLCPAGSGPNSIRLWESLGAGSIPVILADTWAPPGDRRLWEMAAVFCKETPDAIKALPDRLAAIAAEPGRLAQMRHAMRQLWLLYGPDAFVTDVQEFLLGQPVASASVSGNGTDPRNMSGPVDALSARHFLLKHTSRLLLDPDAAKAEIAALPGDGQQLARACELVGDAQLTAHFDTLMVRARITPRRAAPALLKNAAPKFCLFGRHAKRTPLSYAPIRQIIGPRLAQVDTPEEADLVITGFNIDLRENAERLLPLARKKDGPRFVILSEEPLWDITWSGEFTGRDGRIGVPDGEIAYRFLGHETADIYNFDRVPYFVLTENHYAARYANMMAVQARRSPEELLEHWQAAPIRAAFFAEKRIGDTYARAFPERDVAGLSAYRTQLAEAMQGAGVVCMGKGWGAEVRRQDLPDWHLDKLAHLAGRCFTVGAYENVHQHAYISEKIFDAFAIGAVPAYWAGPEHRVFDLVPGGAMINTQGMDIARSAERLTTFVPDMAFAETWLATCARLQALFADFALINAERHRVAEATLAEMQDLV